MTTMAGRTSLSASMFQPAPAPSLSSMPEVEKLARRLAEAQAEALSAISSATWRVTVEAIAEGSSHLVDEQGVWARVESSSGSLTFHHSSDRPAISAFCECAMGGTGSEAAFPLTERPLSAIEKEIARTVGMKLCGRIAAALAEHLNVPKRLFDGEIPAHDNAGGQPMLVMRFIANVFGYSGEIGLAMPASELKAQIMTAEECLDEVPKGSEALQRQIGQAEAALIVSLGQETMRVQEIAELAPGSLVRLSATAASPVIVSSGGKPIYEAELARSGHHLAVRIKAPVK